MRRGFAFVMCLIAGCSASSDPGTGAWLQLEGAQFVPGTMPDADGGPAILAFNVSDYSIAPGARNQPLLGTLDASATSVAVGLDGDRGYWLLLAGVPDTETPTLPSLETKLAFARSIPTGSATLLGRAIDGAGRFGAAASAALTIEGQPLPTGRLVVQLVWDRAVDLDLHVADPAGAEVWANQPSAYVAPPPPATPDPNAIAAAGYLDRDSNRGCVLDGKNREHVVYPTTAPSGHYLVRVDTPSLCGQSVANWSVGAYVDGVLVAAAHGASVDADTIGPHERGAGRLALEFELP